MLTAVASASTPSVVECCHHTTTDSRGKTFLEKKEEPKVPRSEGVLQPHRMDLANEEMEFCPHNSRFFEMRRIGCAKPVKAPFARNRNFDAARAKEKLGRRFHGIGAIDGGRRFDDEIWFGGLRHQEQIIDSDLANILPSSSGHLKANCVGSGEAYGGGRTDVIHERNVAIVVACQEIRDAEGAELRCCLVRRLRIARDAMKFDVGCAERSDAQIGD